MSLFSAPLSYPSLSASSARRFAILGLALVLLAGCGFRPLYAPRDDSAVIAELAAIKVGQIDDRAGQQLRNFLLDRINPRGQPANPKYTLVVELEVSRHDLSIRKDATATRSNLVLTADYTLFGFASGRQLFSASSQVTTSFNIIRSDFGTISAENAARLRGAREISDDIRTRVAVFFNRRRNGGS